MPAFPHIFVSLRMKLCNQSYMKKYMLDMKVAENCRLHQNYCLLKLKADNRLPEMRPGQFVQVRVEHSPTTFLRRPISINYVGPVHWPRLAWEIP